MLARQRVSVYKINRPTLLGLNKFAIQKPDSANRDKYPRVLEYPVNFLSPLIDHPVIIIINIIIIIIIFVEMDLKFLIVKVKKKKNEEISLVHAMSTELRSLVTLNISRVSNKIGEFENEI